MKLFYSPLIISSAIYLNACASNPPLNTISEQSDTLINTVAIPSSNLIADQSIDTLETLGQYEWQLTHIQPLNHAKTEQLKVGLPTKQIFISFHGGFFMEGGCNSVSGPAKIRGNSMILGPLRKTHVQCPDYQLSQVNNEMKNYLKGLLHYERQDRELLITNAVGDILYLTGSPLSPNVH